MQSIQRRIKELKEKYAAQPDVKFDTTDVQIESLLNFANRLGFFPRIVAPFGFDGAFGFANGVKKHPHHVSFEDMLSLHNGGTKALRRTCLDIDQALLAQAEQVKLVETVGLFRSKLAKRLFTNKVYVKFLSEEE